VFKTDSGTELARVADELKTAGTPHVVATVVRTVAVTAAKPGAKAILSADGEVLSGWIGGGCASRAVSVAAKKALEDGQPRLVQLKPEELLNEQGLIAGSDTDGVLVACNMCPSEGTMDIFIEPVLSDPELLVLGGSPIARSVAQLASSLGFSVSVVDTLSESNVSGNNTVAGMVQSSLVQSSLQLSEVPAEHSHRYIVIATQGSFDYGTIKRALCLQSRHLAFVGSRKKISHLKSKLLADGFSDSDRNRLTGPAGIDIGGVTPQEIALSILAEIVQIRRADQLKGPVS